LSPALRRVVTSGAAASDAGKVWPSLAGTALNHPLEACFVVGSHLGVAHAGLRTVGPDGSDGYGDDDGSDGYEDDSD
jgi:hypothetical protein